jgi:RNA polymerase sigma factor (sigma-70 family)
MRGISVVKLRVYTIVVKGMCILVKQTLELECSIMKEEQALEGYYLLIKKYTAYKIKSPDHKELIEDVAQEVFIKLFNRDFFSDYDLNNSEDNKKASSYIAKTVNSCYYDLLTTLGINRRLSQSERSDSGNKYTNIDKSPTEDIDESGAVFSSIGNPEQSVILQDALKWIKSCYESLSSSVKDLNRRQFYEAAFWQFDDYDMPLKELANHMGYKSTNPTQELKRFVEKVSLCTQPHGVKLNKPSEQIQFLLEQIESNS